MKRIVTFKEFLDKLVKDNLTGYAAQSCFYITLSFFPFVMLLLTLIKFLPIEYQTIVSVLEDISPVQLHTFLHEIVTELYEKSSLTLTSVTAIGTLWASGKGIMSLMQGFNSIYDIEENRNFFLQRLIATFYTVLFLIIIVLSLSILVFGNQLFHFISRKFPNISMFTNAFMDQKYIILPCILILFFMCMYKFIPNRKTSILYEFPGALIASLGWYLFSYFYSLYVDNTPNFSYMYGSLTTFVFALIWIYSCMIILFLGAETNTFIEIFLFNSKKLKKFHKS